MCFNNIQNIIIWQLYFTILLSSFIHLFVILLVLSGCDIIHPLLIVEVPTYSLLNALLELQLGLRPSVGRGVLPPLSSAGCYQHPINASFAHPSSLWILSAYYRFAYIFS